MQVRAETVDDAIRRLRRVEGQVAGIVRMLEAGRDCADVVTQLSAASKALDQVGFKIVVSGLRDCFADEESAAAGGYGQEEFERLFLKLA